LFTGVVSDHRVFSVNQLSYQYPKKIRFEAQ